MTTSINQKVQEYGKMRVWHYTVGINLIKILEDNAIKPADAYISKGERAAVWLTTCERWEQTANKIGFADDGRMLSLSKRETDYVGKGLIRIEVDPACALYTWSDFLRLSGVPKKIGKGLVRIAEAKGSDVSLWRVNFEPITREQWRTIEIEINDEWIDFCSLRS